MMQRTFPDTVLTPLTFLERSVRVFPDKVAVQHGARSYTYREFGAQVRRLASALRAHGVRPGDRVAFLCPNIPPMLEAHFGVLLAGAILVPINIRLSVGEIAYILEHSGSQVLFLDSEWAGIGEALRNDVPGLRLLVSIVDDAAFPPLEGLTYEDFLATGSEAAFPHEVTDEHSQIAINYTSGTTGRPKGVVFTHRGAYINALGECIESQLTADAVYLWTLPMFHCNGWCFTWGVTALGATHVCLRKVDPALAWPLIQEHGVTHFNGAPVVLIALVNHPGAPERFAQPVTVTVAGAPPSPTIIETVTHMGGHIIHVYGLTEVYGPFTVCAWQAPWRALPAEEQGRLLARQGVPFAVDGEVRVVDAAMQDVPADGQTLGEVVLRGNMVMQGYWNDPEATAQAFRGGWFHTGDIAVMDPDGYIALRDRSKDVIISGGENISSIEVEQALYRHPAVLECAVVGAPHDKWGETPVAHVTLKEGQSLTEAELIAFCKQHLAGFKAPTAIHFGPLPKTSTGKIQKFVLREAAWTGKVARIQG